MEYTVHIIAESPPVSPIYIELTRIISFLFINIEHKKTIPYFS